MFPIQACLKINPRAVVFSSLFTKVKKVCFFLCRFCFLLNFLSPVTHHIILRVTETYYIFKFKAYRALVEIFSDRNGFSFVALSKTTQNKTNTTQTQPQITNFLSSEITAQTQKTKLYIIIVQSYLRIQSRKIKISILSRKDDPQKMDFLIWEKTKKQRQSVRFVVW